MPTVLQFRRGTTAQNNSFTGSDGELSLDTDLYTIRVHDGSTAGGFEITQNTATQTLTNKTINASNNTISNITNAMLSGSAGITNANLANSDVTIGSTSISLGATSTTLAGLTSVTSTGFVGDLTGNADTATALSSAVTVELTGPVTGSATFTSAGDTASISTTLTADPTITLTGAVTGSATMTNLGNVSITTTATSDPTITLAGDLSGSATLTNLGDATLTATIVANSVALGTDTTGSYVQSLVAGTGVTLTNNSGEGATPTIAIGQEVGTSDDVTFGNVAVSGTVDGRDIATDGTKLDTIETNADVTDATNVAAAGAAMTSNNLSDLSNASTARTNLGVAIGSNVQAYDADLTAIGGLTKTNGNFIVGNGSTWVAESGATARASLGLTIGTNVQAYSSVLQNTTASFVTADETKLDYISVTQAVDLDQMETDIAALANGMVYKGDWDASAGSFPGGGSAQTGWFYYVSVAGTVNGISFAVGDNIVATTDNASTSTYAGNWSKHDQTDAVQAVVGLTGSIDKSSLLSALNVEDGADVTDATNVAAAGALMTTGGSVTGNVSFGDDDQAIFGAGSDLTIKSDGTNAIIQGAGTTYLRGSTLIFSANGGAGGFETGIRINEVSAETSQVELYYDNGLILETVSGGVDITGSITVSGTVDGRDVATDGTKLDGIAAGATNVTNNNQLTNGAGYTTNTGTVTSVSGGTGLSGTVTTSGSLSIDSTVATLTGSQTLTNKTLTSPIISSISNTGTLTLPTSTGTVALTSDIPTNNNELTNGAGYTTNTGDITNVSVSGTGLSGGGSSGSVTITSNATSANTGSTIVARDGSGNFTAGTINATNVDISSTLDIGSEVVLTESTDRADLLLIKSTTSGWGGIQISNSSNEGLWSFMTDGSTGGIYDDQNGDWAIQFIENSEVRLYHNGSEKLNTNSGGVTITGVMSGTATSARYADLAEKYTSDRDYEPGTVVELGGEQEVTQTRRSRSTAIAGIVSTNPAHLMNDQLKSQHVVDVALIGRVPCMVTGIINKGDLLVSSSRPGHACAWTNATNPPAGSIVGKAIENKTDEDPGVIEVLVGRL